MISESTKVSGFPITTTVESWKTNRIGGICDIYNGATPSTADHLNWDGEVIWLTPTDLSNKSGKYIHKGERNITQIGYESSAASLAPKGSIAISTRAPIGHIAILMESACVNQGCRLLVPNESLASEFLYYFLIVNIDNLQSLGQGSTFVELSNHNLSNAEISMPSLEVQLIIVKYLDHADIILRGGVSQKQRLAELMEEYKRAVIQQAVTRGLDPDVPLKPSGVEWLGDIPEHWVVRRLKTCVSNVIDKGTGYDRGICLALEHVEGWTGKYWDAGADFVLDSDMKCFQPNDVLFGKLRPYLAKVARPDSHGICVGEFLVLRPLNDLVSPEFLEYLLRSQHTIDAVNASTFGARMPRADWQFIGDMLHAFPLPAEQTAIVAHLDKLTSDIDAAIAHTRREIELLEEYRTRLIADVVTGKLDVREAAANLSNIDLADTQLPKENDATID